VTRRTTILIAVALVALDLIVYAPVRHFDFVQLDDPAYVTENPQVLKGLTGESVVWALTTGHAANWHPVTWLSHMLDVQLFGVAPGAHHAVNLLLHIVNTLLLFGILLRLTGATWRSAFVAALFGVHPLHVESVAWVAERKDVLSTLFWMLTTWAYVAFARAPRSEAASSASRGRRTGLYLLALASFSLGLMAKPMLVTLPFVLLLLDWWPLGRWTPGRPLDREAHPVRNIWPLVREKVPLFALAAASSVVTVIAQQRGGAVSTLETNPFGLRLQNAVVAVVAYLRDMLWPAGLTVFYPFPESVPGWQLAVACLVLLAISAAVFRLARREPYLPVGWLWYLGTLVPVAGLVRVGLQARADRYTYVPLIGVFIMMAWGAASVAARVRVLRHGIPVAAAAGVLVCALAAREQVGYWKDNVTLWTRATMLTLHVDQYEAHMSLGTSLGNQGRIDEAGRHFAEAVRLRPQSDAARYSLGLALAKTGRAAEAADEFNEALRLNPGNEAARRAVEGMRRRDQQ
jgi:protein O-mannosyl-transferase